MPNEVTCLLSSTSSDFEKFQPICQHGYMLAYGLCVVHLYMTKRVNAHFIQQAIYEFHLSFDEYYSFSQRPGCLQITKIMLSPQCFNNKVPFPNVRFSWEFFYLIYEIVFRIPSFQRSLETVHKILFPHSESSISANQSILCLYVASKGAYNQSCVWVCANKDDSI